MRTLIPTLVLVLTVTACGGGNGKTPDAGSDDAGQQECRRDQGDGLGARPSHGHHRSHRSPATDPQAPAPGPRDFGFTPLCLTVSVRKTGAG